MIVEFLTKNEIDSEYFFDDFIIHYLYIFFIIFVKKNIYINIMKSYFSNTILMIFSLFYLQNE